MADEPAGWDAATRLAARLRDDPDGVEPVTAADTGIALLNALESDADAAPLRVVTSLIGFAVRTAPDHPSAPEWWGELGFAHGWLGEETDAAADYDTALACLFTAVSAAHAAPDVAEGAAIEIAHLTGSLLCQEVQENDTTAERARRLIGALDGIALSWTDAARATRFDIARARALRWAYASTDDIADLERATDLLRGALAAPVSAQADDDNVDDRVDEWRLLVDLLEERYLQGGDLAPLHEALAAAVRVSELLPEDDEWLPEAHGVVAGIATEIFWNTDAGADAALETAVASFAAKRVATDLDDDETVSYAQLLRIRGCTADDVPALLAAVEVLETPEWHPGSETALAGLHELLIHLVGPRHAWPTVDWATRALCRDDLDPGSGVFLHDMRVIGIAAALEAFGGDEVAARYDVDGMLSAARVEAAADDDALRAELGFHAAELRGRWTTDRSPLDIDLFRATSAETADALLRMRDHAEEGRRPGLTAVATLLRDMVPVIMGDRDPGQFLATLRDDSLAGLADVDGLLKWIERRTALHTLLGDAGRGQAVGSRLREVVDDMVRQVPESERATGPGALIPLMSELAALSGTLETGDRAARAAASRKLIRLCDELPENLASSPFVRGIRGHLGAQLADGGEDGDQVQAAIEDLERALDQSAGRWPTDATEPLGYLLRRRGGPGDAERSRRLGLGTLVEWTWRVLTGTNRELPTPPSRFGWVVAMWCREDGAHDDLVRVMEAERGLALARGAGIDLLRAHLVDTGRADLADTTTGERLDPIARLSEVDKAALTEPPEPREIQAALRERGLDALVYLAPGPPTAGGLMAVVPADGAVTSAVLPLLSDEWCTGKIDADAVGGWAWLAAGAAVLAAARAAAPARDVPRIALVPVGALGAAPWAAAWRDTAAGRRHLVEDVETTIVPSARLLVRRPPVGGEPAIQPRDPRRAPGPDHDEALEPASRLLIGGASTVIRSVWPDVADTVFLALFRHHLGAHPNNPAGALRAAQLWMLDPGRELPAGVSTNLANPADIANWGGFAAIGI